jgi:hypothetical protein
VRLEGLGKLEKSNDLIGKRTPLAVKNVVVARKRIFLVPQMFH